MLILSGIYAVGRGTPKDNLSAYRWAYVVSVGTRVEEFRNGSRQLISVLETRMTPAEINQAKADAGRWHAVSSQAKPAGPADDAKRDSRSPQPSPAVSKPAPASSANNSVDSAKPQGPPSTNVKKSDSDMDALMDKVPSELRKRLGF
jgi:hypothetical protein